MQSGAGLEKYQSGRGIARPVQAGIAADARRARLLSMSPAVEDEAPRNANSASPRLPGRGPRLDGFLLVRKDIPGPRGKKLRFRG
jgi:hypothetical protein